MNKNQVEIRYSVSANPIGSLAILVGKLVIAAGLCIFFSLFVSSHLFFHPYHEATGNNTTYLTWVFRTHSPAFENAIHGIFLQEFWPTYSALCFGLVSLLIFIFFVLRAKYRAKTFLDISSGKVQPVPPALSEKHRGAFAGKYKNRVLWSTIQDRALVIGPPGTGKTTFLMNQVLRSMHQKRDFIAMDIKPELSDTLKHDLKSAGYAVLEIDPVNGSGKRYNLLTDIDDDSDIFELCESLIPSSASDPSWTRAERAYFRLALLYLRHKHIDKPEKCSLPAAYHLIGCHPTAKSFLLTVKRCDHKAVRQAAEKLLGQLDSSKPVEAGFGGVFDQLNWLSLDPVSHTLSESDFSLKALGKTKMPVALFLKFDETRLETMGSLLSVLYGHIMNVLIKTSPHRRPVTLYLDEIGNIPSISGLLSKLNTIRSRQIPCWMYWQSTQQMSKYGHGAREVFFGSADLQIFFRSNDIDTMETVQKLSGKVTIPKYSQSTDGSSITNSVTSERVDRIEGAELAELAAGQVITLYKGLRFFGEATPHYADFKQYRKDTF